MLDISVQTRQLLFNGLSSCELKFKVIDNNLVCVNSVVTIIKYH